MKSQQWYLIALFMLLCLFSVVAGGLEGVPHAVMAQTVPSPLPPENDNFANAALIDMLPFTGVSDIGAATTEPDEPQNCYYMSRSIWYRYSPTVDTALQLDMSGSTFGDTVLNVWQGSTREELTSVSCTSWNNATSFTARAGQTYYMQVGRAYDNFWGELHLNVAQILPPPNDNFANGSQIGTVPYNDLQDMTLATAEATEPHECAGSALSKTIWYAYTPVVRGSLYASVMNNDAFAIYTGSALGNLNLVVCRYYGGGGLVFAAQPGITYYFQVGTLYDYNRKVTFQLNMAPLPVSNFDYSPSEPSIFDSIQFYDSSWDPADGGFRSATWNFGDGAVSEDRNPRHQYATDGDYAVTLLVTTNDGRTASTSGTVTVKTHDVAITKLTVPNAASANQTRNIVVGLNSRRYDENVTVELFTSNPGDTWNPWLRVGELKQFVPVRSANRTTDFNFSYTFTADDARVGKVTFKAVARIENRNDALPADNEVIALPTKVTTKGRDLDSSETESTTQAVQIFLPLVVNK